MLETIEFQVQSDKKTRLKMSIQKKISEEFKVEIKEHFNDVSASVCGSCGLGD